VGAKIRDHYTGASAAGKRELASVSLILGQVLEALAVETHDRVA
jgi:hypothetical protein